MPTKLSLSLPVIVEGKYDKIKLSSLLDAHIITTDGFSLFNQKEKARLLRALCEKSGVIVLTDSDGGGKQIRAYLSEILPKDKIYHLYIPKIHGKEKRKDKAGKAGLLGVEGMDASLLRELFLPFSGETPPPRGGITKSRFYLDGLSGTPDAASRRAALARHLGFPEDMTANALLEALNLLYDEAAYTAILQEIF